VIVPPVQPGWPDANATLMGQAASRGEGAYNQASRSDVPANEWEGLIAQGARLQRRRRARVGLNGRLEPHFSWELARQPNRSG